MASSSVYTKKSFKGLDTRKSQSWWWDSHIGSRNSKWLAENLEEMDQNHRRMLELIEGDGDSLAKKAEMYYQRRPELLSHVEHFYRTYKSLVERYEHLTGELRKHLLPELQSQGIVGFDSGSEASSLWPSQDLKISHRKSGHRAAGFDFFLGAGRSGLDRSAKGDETSSVSDSETESDVSSLHSYPGILVNIGEEGQQVRPSESEAEAFGDDKLQVQQQDNKIMSLRRSSSENFDDVHSKIVSYEEELKTANKKISQSEEEIANLRVLLQKFTSSESSSSLLHEFPAVENSTVLYKAELGIDDKNILELEESRSSTEADVAQPEEKMRVLLEELRITKGSVQALDKEVTQLKKENRESSENFRKIQDLFKMAQKDAAMWKGKVETEKRQASKLQERILRYKTSLTDRENEVRELKEVISDTNRKYQLHAEISRLADEKTCLEERVREWEVRCHSLETQRGVLERKLHDEIEHLKADNAEKTGQVRVLESDIDAYRLKHDGLLSETSQLNAEISARDGQVVQMAAEIEEARKEAEELRLKVEELREEIERQNVSVLEAAEGKREAIRQLCFSLEHYRNGYQQLRQAFTGHKQLQVLAS